MPSAAACRAPEQAIIQFYSSGAARCARVAALVSGSSSITGTAAVLGMSTDALYFALKFLLQQIRTQRNRPLRQFT